MKKLFTSFLAAGTVASFAFCAQNEANTAAEETTTETEETTTETEETTTVVKGKVAKGTFKVGYAGSNTEYTNVLKTILTSYTQDTVNKTATGSEFFKLPSGLFLNSSDKYNAYIREDSTYSNQLDLLEAKLKTLVAYLEGDEADFNVAHGTESTLYEGRDGALNTGYDSPIQAFLGITGAANTLAENADYDKIFTRDRIIALYEALETSTPTRAELKAALIAAGFDVKASNVDFDASSPGVSDVRTIVLNGNTAVNSATINLGITKTWATIQEEFRATVTTSLDDKTKLASKNIDALFVHVTDEVENKSDIYKAVVEKKQFKATKLFFIGEESKAQSGASSKVFAGENVSTASFNEYAAAYIGGFQAAVGAIKFSGSEDVYEQTSVAFLIGSTSESTDKKKAFAFRRGVEAAAAHEAYSKYLTVRFVSKTEDSSKSSKKLYREISEWKAKDDSKYKLYEFSSSDTFSDADRRVVYIAGSTAGHWTGVNSETEAVSTDTTWDVQTHKADDKGLIGALYNYSEGADGDLYSSLTSKTFSRGVWVVLDRVDGVGQGVTGTSADIDENKLNYKSGVTAKAGFAAFERHDVKFYGSIGTEIEGTKAYAKAALKGLYMGGPSYMIGKHTIFGAGLELTYVTKSDDAEATVWTKDSDNTVSTYSSMWANSGGKDSNTKAEGRFKDSFAHATEKELIEEELVKTSPWLK